MSIRRNRPLRGAIVGFGNVAVEGHLPAFGSGRHFAIQAVCDPDEGRLARAAELLPEARRYAQLDELLEQERLDFVDVAAPPTTHAAIVLAALARKVHVLCEKPLAVGMDDLGRIRSAARAAGATVFTVHNWKYAPLFLTAKRALRRGDLGRVTRLSLETLRTAPPPAAAGSTWRLDPALAGGGILVDHGWHAFYLALYLLEAEPVAVTARMSQRKLTDGAAEDTAECAIEFPEATAEILLTWAADARQNRGRIEGEHGVLEIADRVLISRVADRPPVETAFAQPLSAGSYHPDWFATLLADFRTELLEAGARGANLREAETTCRLVDLSYRSHAAGGVRLALRDAAAPTAPGA